MKIKYLFVSLVALASCSPSKTIYIRNQTGRPVKVVINTPGKNPFFSGMPSVIYLNTHKHQRDTVLDYGKGKRWTDTERDELEKIFNESIIIFTDRGDTLKAKKIAVQNIGLNVNELYLRIKNTQKISD
jgi:hypothetical protein